MTDAELEAHIAACGQLMQGYFALYQQSVQPEDLEAANRWRLVMEQAIGFRSAAQVRQMEAERGLN